ncbi:MAG: DUF5596 domain-containing protein [Clostridia bacterium]|nr:DUF5596 domain-containing protein [Clostridia bacterium]
MRAYLEQFFEEYGYSERDTGELLRAYDAIVANGVAKETWEALLDTYAADINCDLAQMQERAAELSTAVKLHPYTLKLLFYICLTRQAKVCYAARGLSDTLFYDTMMDLKYKLIECREVYGICGSFVCSWFVRFFKLTRFALGRLQFEVDPFRHSYEKNGVVLTPESRVINVHIPRTGTPMDEASCNEAFRLAKAFFASEIGNAPTAFVCHSWLLFPQHETMLSETSNVYKFMKRFDILESGEYENLSELWRLFDRPFISVDNLPYDSSLRRAYVDRIKGGGKTGWGYGVFLY